VNVGVGSRRDAPFRDTNLLSSPITGNAQLYAGASLTPVVRAG
jgi:hypothetical protein